MLSVAQVYSLPRQGEDLASHYSFRPSRDTGLYLTFKLWKASQYFDFVCNVVLRKIFLWQLKLCMYLYI